MATSVAVTLPKLQAAADTVALTVARLGEFVSSTVSAGSLQLLIDAALDTIAGVIGPPGDVSETFSPHGDRLMLSRRAESVVSVVENQPWAPVTLVADDYGLSSSGYIVTRLRTGTNPRWAWSARVAVTYRPPDDTARRVTAAIDLVRLEIAFNPGLASQTIGTWAESYTSSGSSGRSYAEQRADILAALESAGGIV
jgi:hypothetical protein